MKLILYNFRIFVIRTLRFLLRCLKLNILSDIDYNGIYSPSLSLKFTKKNIISVPFSLGRTIRGVSFDIENGFSPDPFVNALNTNNGVLDRESFFNHLLMAFEKEKDKMIYEYPIGLSQDKYNFPIYSYAYPWESASIEKKLIKYSSDVLVNRSSYLKSVSIDIYDVSHIESHFLQFNSLLQSIVNNGFIDNDDPPKVFILYQNNEWRWIMSGDGNHRAYVCNLLSHKFLSVCIQGSFNKESLYKLSLKNGHSYSYSEISYLFDQIWSGQNCLRGIV